MVDILRKEDKTMEYTKPEVTVVGQAIDVIESIPAKGGSVNDGTLEQLDPAYDLDE